MDNMLLHELEESFHLNITIYDERIIPTSERAYCPHIITMYIITYIMVIILLSLLLHLEIKE